MERVCASCGGESGRNQGIEKVRTQVNNQSQRPKSITEVNNRSQKPESKTKVKNQCPQPNPNVVRELGGDCASAAPVCKGVGRLTLPRETTYHEKST